MKQDSADDPAPELPIPAAALREGDALEVVRVWLAGGRQHIAVRTVWSDPAAWGLLLVDLAKNVAGAYESGGHLAAEEALKRIFAGFDAERAGATDT